MSGHSFQFTPGGGIVAAGDADDDDAIVPANAALFAQPERVEAPKAQPARRISFDKPLNVVKAAKARLRDVEREIKKLRALEKERDELRRLLDAATNKPRAIVREITTAKRG